MNRIRLLEVFCSLTISIKLFTISLDLIEFVIEISFTANIYMFN